MTAERQHSRPGLVSVVIPAYNAADVIGQQLDALARQTYEGQFEVVVVDNRSTDALDAAVAPYTEVLDVRVVRAPSRVGVSHARNVGCTTSRGELVAICDADDVADRGWLAALVAASADADLLGGARDLRRLNSPKVQRWRVMPTDRLQEPLSFLPYAAGANVALWRRVFDVTGGWDEDLVGGGDDIEFAWRAQLRGFTLAYAADAVVHYRLRGELAPTMRQISVYAAACAPLLKTYRAAGARPSPRARLASEVGWLLTRLPYLVMFGSWRQGRWLVKAASLWGRTRGSLRHRVWAL